MVDYNENIRQSIVNNRFQLWRDFLANLERTAEPEHSVVRFPYSSTYIFSTGSSCFWMVDPGYTYVNAPQEELEELAKLIREKISFILVTHLHVDHCQPEWVKALAGSSVEWVVSERFAADFFKGCGGSPANTLLLADDETIELNGIKITARAGYHGEPGKPTVTSCAYDVELPDGIKLFFPADVRDPQQSVPEGKVDYTFGHVFLGREDATGNDFPHLEAVSRFLAKRPSGHLFLNHLYEICRNPPDLWTHRHTEMIREQLKNIAPEMHVTAPHFGDAAVLTGGANRYPDLFKQWQETERQDFINHLGISIKKEHNAWMEEVISRQIPVVEWSYHLLNDVPLEQLQEQAERWRKAGGKCLSLHMPGFPAPDDRSGTEYFRTFVEKSCAVQVDRVTIHVPYCILGEAEEKLDGILDYCAELIEPLLASGIRIGVENLHMKPTYQADKSRPMGFIPQEVLQMVNGLRERCNSELIGCHLDIGHAYSNYPYAEKYDMTVWLKECGHLINGLHLHQFECAATAEKPYLSGHALISGRTTGHPNLHPLYAAWEQGIFHAPMILEIIRDAEQQPFSSLERLKYLFGTSMKPFR